MSEDKKMVVYDYMTKEVRKNKEAMIRDCYESFGWELVSKETSVLGSVILNFRRDRNLKKNIQLKDSQRKMEKIIDDTDTLERQKTSSGMTLALIIGVIGALILGGGMSLAMFNETNIPLFVVGIIVGVVGIVVCCINYPIYRKVVKSKTTKLSILIEEKNDELSDILIDAYKLTNE